MAIPRIDPYPMPAVSELPENHVTWRVDPERAVVLVHDMQYYFVDFFAEGESPREELVANTRRVRDAARWGGLPVVYTAQPGDMSTEERGLLRDMWGPGMGSDPEAKSIVEEVVPHEHDIVLTKWRYSAFARSNLERIMARLGRDQLIICGVYAHVGCLMTACDAFTGDIQPFLVADAVADFSAEYHRMALSYVAERCGVVTATEPLVRELAGEVAAVPSG